MVLRHFTTLTGGQRTEIRREGVRCAPSSAIHGALGRLLGLSPSTPALQSSFLSLARGFRKHRDLFLPSNFRFYGTSFMYLAWHSPCKLNVSIHARRSAYRTCYGACCSRELSEQGKDAPIAGTHPSQANDKCCRSLGRGPTALRGRAMIDLLSQLCRVFSSMTNSPGSHRRSPFPLTS